MPTEREFDRVADELLPKGKPVSLRPMHMALVAALGTGGSNRDLAPLLTDWKDKRDYRPKLGLRGCPNGSRPPSEWSRRRCGRRRSRRPSNARGCWLDHPMADRGRRHG